MTNWKDKYKDLEIGQSAWYWHKPSGNIYKWSLVKVKRIHIPLKLVEEDGGLIAFGDSFVWISATEDFPNGPKVYYS